MEAAERLKVRTSCCWILLMNRVFAGDASLSRWRKQRSDHNQRIGSRWAKEEEEKHQMVKAFYCCWLVCRNRRVVSYYGGELRFAYGQRKRGRHWNVSAPVLFVVLELTWFKDTFIASVELDEWETKELQSVSCTISMLSRWGIVDLRLRLVLFFCFFCLKVWNDIVQSPAMKNAIVTELKNDPNEICTTLEALQKKLGEENKANHRRQ